MEFGAKQIARLPEDVRKRIVQRQGDVTKMPYGDAEFSFAYCNPPFHSTEKYGGKTVDLAESGDLDTWLLRSTEMMREAFRVLRPGSLCVTVMADYRAGGKLILVQHLVSAQLKVWRSHYNLRRTAKSHEYVVVFRKPEEDGAAT